METLILEFAKQNPEQARTIFNNAIANTTDRDHVARLEVVREYACNPEFKATLSGFVWNINQAAN